jgi:hypothetical protein
MKEWPLNFKNNSVSSCFFMINILRIKIWISREYKLLTLYLDGSW